MGDEEETIYQSLKDVALPGKNLESFNIALARWIPGARRPEGTLP